MGGDTKASKGRPKHLPRGEGRDGVTRHGVMAAKSCAKNRGEKSLSLETPFPAMKGEG